MITSSPAKASVECPHCGFKQMEYVAAKSTICRQCGRSFSPSAPKPGTPEAELPLHRRLETMWSRQRKRVVSCFECKRKHEVSDAASSTNCPGCSAHIDLRDYKIATSFSRSIRTRGDVNLTTKGDLSSTSVICTSAIIEGKLRGNLECEDSMTINLVGKIPGRIGAHHMIVERKSDIQCFRRVRVTNIDIKGRMSGEILASGAVTIHKGGTLDGTVTAKSIAIEKGGMFSGQLAIGQANLTQGELLPEAKAAGKKAEPEVPAGGAQPLHAT
ncbi:MAG TPA: polymer-forming cytoskeletal protein [Chthoniobacterales bacterium]|nr:polymer-forming cytoskeletal protein [Chthoniobacterales bacterium]